MLFLLSLALATESVNRADLKPDPRRNVRDAAHVLDWGEVLFGTDGLAVGVLPAVQLSTQPILDSIGWINGAGKVEAIRSKALCLSLQGGGSSVSWGQFSGHSLDLGSTTTVIASRALSLSAGPRYRVLRTEGVPTEVPPVMAEWLPMESLQSLAQNSSDAGIVPRIYTRSVDLQAAIEVRINRRDSIRAAGSYTLSGANGTTVVPPGESSPAVAQQAASWIGKLGQGGNRSLVLSYQISFGAADVRVGAGVSDIPAAWVSSANGVNLRAFGASRREDRRLLTEAQQASDTRVARASTDAGLP